MEKFRHEIVAFMPEMMLKIARADIGTARLHICHVYNRRDTCQRDEGRETEIRYRKSKPIHLCTILSITESICRQAALLPLFSSTIISPATSVPRPTPSTHAGNFAF